MAQGRLNSAMITVLMLLFFTTVSVIHSEIPPGITYIVVGPSGWTFNVTDWTNGKTFRPNDIVVFTYDPALHNVVVVNEGSYNVCHIKAGSKTFQTGRDKITLGPGKSFFVSGFPGDCQAGMKIAVNALG